MMFERTISSMRMLPKVTGKDFGELRFKETVTGAGDQDVLCEKLNRNFV